MTDSYLERERTYDTDDELSLPDLGADAPETATLTTTYFDTEDGLLQLRGVTLRSRSGGGDDGWHLKVPQREGRLELRLAPGPATPPAELVSLTTGLRLGRPVTRRAVLTTTRTTHAVRSADGALVAEVADDLVVATRAPGGGEVRWREIEVELGPAGTDDDLDRLGERLQRAGAVPAGHGSKLARALGPPESASRVAELGGLAGLVESYLQTQYERLSWGDLRLRRGENSVHRTRVAVRRIRSTLRSFAPLLDPDRTQRLDDELAWYAAVLGEVRDLDLITRTLAADLEDDALLPDGAAPDVLHALHARRQGAWQSVLTTLDGHRYAALLRQVDEWRCAAPYTEGAQRDAHAVDRLVRRARKKSDKRLRQARRSHGRAADTAYHRARKAAKRTRYAAELATPALGKPAKRLARSHEKRQDRLGELQDHVALIGLLGALSARDLSPGTAFTCGVLAQRHEHARRLLLREL
jgi:CHAD domain-containing protein